MQLVFVCSGNTCRSPLARCAWDLAVREISERGGSKRGAAFSLAQIQASSAGLCASPGAPASLHAQAIARSWGQDLSGHQAIPFRPEHARAELLIAMTRSQCDVLHAHFNVVRGQLRLLGDYAPSSAMLMQVSRLAPLWDEDWSASPFDEIEAEADILDPRGGSLEAYEACATQIRRSVFELARILADLE